jgi:hypothetical protein
MFVYAVPTIKTSANNPICNVGIVLNVSWSMKSIVIVANLFFVLSQQGCRLLCLVLPWVDVGFLC